MLDSFNRLLPLIFNLDALSLVVLYFFGAVPTALTKLLLEIAVTPAGRFVLFAVGIGAAYCPGPLVYGHLDPNQEDAHYYISPKIHLVSPKSIRCQNIAVGFGCRLLVEYR